MKNVEHLLLKEKILNIFKIRRKKRLKDKVLIIAFGNEKIIWCVFYAGEAPIPNFFQFFPITYLPIPIFYQFAQTLQHQASHVSPIKQFYQNLPQGYIICNLFIFHFLPIALKLTIFAVYSFPYYKNITLLVYITHFCNIIVT